MNNEQAKAKWLEQELDYYGSIGYECSNCKEIFCFEVGNPKDNLYKYCPNCGAEMESENEQRYS